MSGTVASHANGLPFAQASSVTPSGRLSSSYYYYYERHQSYIQWQVREVWIRHFETVRLQGRPAGADRWRKLTRAIYCPLTGRGACRRPLPAAFNCLRRRRVVLRDLVSRGARVGATTIKDYQWRTPADDVQRCLLCYDNGYLQTCTCTRLASLALWLLQLLLLCHRYVMRRTRSRSHRAKRNWKYLPSGPHSTCFDFLWICCATRRTTSCIRNTHYKYRVYGKSTTSWHVVLVVRLAVEKIHNKSKYWSLGLNDVLQNKFYFCYDYSLMEIGYWWLTHIVFDAHLSRNRYLASFDLTGIHSESPVCSGWSVSFPYKS